MGLYVCTSCYNWGWPLPKVKMNISINLQWNLITLKVVPKPFGLSLKHFMTVE